MRTGSLDEVGAYIAAASSPQIVAWLAWEQCFEVHGSDQAPEILGVYEPAHVDFVRLAEDMEEAVNAPG